MKSKEQKYDEAVIRNLENAERKDPKKYRGVKLAHAKLMIGIRKDDARYDERVHTLTRIGMPNPTSQATAHGQG
jgi:hypothetical protein